MCRIVARGTDLNCNRKDVQLWEKVLLAGGKELEQIQQTFIFVH